MRNFGQLWPTLKRLLAYGKPWRKPLSMAVVMLWVAAADFRRGGNPQHNHRHRKRFTPGLAIRPQAV